MVKYNVANNAYTTLAESITKADKKITVEGTSTLPDVPFLMTLEFDEIAEVTNVSDNVLTVVRGQEGKTSKAYGKGTQIDVSFTAGMYDVLETESGAQTKADESLTDSKEYTDTKIQEIDVPEVENLTLTELTLGNYKIVFNEAENSLDLVMLP